MTHAGNQLQSSPSRVAYLVAICIFVVCLTRTTDVLYLRTINQHVLSPANIIAGKSQAPNQYRVLAPLLYEALDKVIHNPAKSDHIVIFLSILAAYVAAGALFYRSSRSMPVTALGLLALLGCFSLGMLYKYRQEFFEVALVSVALLVVVSVRRSRVMYPLLALVTLLGTLNRETYAFCVSAIAAQVLWQRVTVNREPAAKHIMGIIALVAVFVVGYIGPRWYFGLLKYHCRVWTYPQNIENLMDIASAYHLGYIGAGLVFAYLATVIKGNRWYVAFIVGYAAPMLVVVSATSRFGEHRIFYPLMVLLVASMLKFSFKTEQALVVESGR